MAAQLELHELILQHLRSAEVPSPVLDSVCQRLAGADRAGRQLQSSLLERFVQTPGKRGPPKGASTQPARNATNAANETGRRSWMLAAAGTFLLSMVFAPCVTYSEWYIDELFAAVRNADARGETPLRDILQHDFWGNSLAGGWTHKSYRPLVVLSFVLQYWMNSWNFRPQPLRAFNVALHSLNSLLLLFLMRQLRFTPRMAFLAAGAFAVHPVHAENVIYLVGRADSMSACCWLLACSVWLAGRSLQGTLAYCIRTCLVVLLALVSGFCKESGFCVLLQLAVMELLGKYPFRRAGMLIIIFTAVFGCRSWITQGTSAGFSFVDTPVQYRSDPWLRAFTYLYFHAKYAQLMLWPWTLSWDYSYNALPDLASTWRDLRVLAILPAYLGICAVASWGFSKRCRPILIGLSNVIIPFVPASNLFFLVGVTVGERLLYPCNIGAALVAAALGTNFERRIVHQTKASATLKHWFVGGGFLAVFLWLAALRTYQWSSRELLFAADAASYPQSTKHRHQLGTVLHKMERFDEALHHYEAAEKIFDGTGLTQYCIGQIFLETGRAAEAEAKFAQILSGHALGFGSHNLWSLYVDYGFSFVLLRRFDEAIAPLKEGLRRNEDVPYGLNALGYAYIHLGQKEESRAAFQLGLKYDPDNAYLENNVGIAKLMLGQLNEGAMHVAKAAQLEPGVPAFSHNVALLNELADTGRWPSSNLAVELFYHRGI